MHLETELALVPWLLKLLSRDGRIYHPWKEEAYQRGICGTSNRYEFDAT